MASSGKPASASSLRERLGNTRTQLAHFWHKEIWLSSHLKDSSPRGLLYACLRIISISATVFTETKAASRAAALSFSSLLGLGPLVALTVLIAGFALEKSDDGKFSDSLSESQRAATGINRLADNNVVVLDALVRQDITTLKQRGSLRSFGEFSRRRTDAELTGAGLDQLTPTQLEQLDAVAAAKIAGGAVSNRNKAAVDALGRLINFVAPQLGQYRHPPDYTEGVVGAAPAGATNSSAPSGGSVSATEISPMQPAPVNPELLELLDKFISGARSGSAGAFGVFTLILIVLLLFKTIEDTFNEIWGVRSGRSLIMRVVYYWTVLTLGAVLFFASVTLLGAGAFINVFKEATEKLPFSSQMAVLLQWSLPLFSFALLVVLLTAFYRVIPNTRVYWRAAFVGAGVVAALLLLNNYLAFLYVKRVILEESLYGSLGILPVLMFGLYIFWLYVLIGGQISYAVQNVHFRNSQAAWGNLSEAMRERLSLIALLSICRRFQACLPPVSPSELGTLIKVPTQILNECVNRLVDMNLVTPVPPPPDSSSTELLYQPARPLNRISLWEFKRLDDNLGDSPAGVALEGLDPILNRYDAALEYLGEQAFFQKNLEELFAEFAFEGHRGGPHASSAKK